MKSDLVDIEVVIHAETEKAILVSTDGDKNNATWLPKSQIEYERKGKSFVVTMPEWLAIDKDLA